MKDLDELSLIGRETGNRGITRLGYTLEEDKAFNYIEDQASCFGLMIKYDRYGNLYCMHPTQKISEISEPILAGSHLDTVENVGIFDGTVG